MFAALLAVATVLIVIIRPPPNAYTAGPKLHPLCSHKYVPTPFLIGIQDSLPRSRCLIVLPSTPGGMGECCVGGQRCCTPPDGKDNRVLCWNRQVGSNPHNHNDIPGYIILFEANHKTAVTMPLDHPSTATKIMLPLDATTQLIPICKLTSLIIIIRIPSSLQP